MSTLIYNIVKGEVIEIEPVNGFIQIVPIYGSIGYLIGIGGATPSIENEFVNMPTEYKEKSFELDDLESVFLKGIGKFAINVGTKI